jgi:hypothetical protein
MPPRKAGAAVPVEDDMEPSKAVKSGGARSVLGKTAPKGKVSFLVFYKSGCLKYRSNCFLSNDDLVEVNVEDSGSL